MEALLCQIQYFHAITELRHIRTYKCVLLEYSVDCSVSSIYIYKAEKLSVYPSICNAANSTTKACIDTGL